MELDIFKTKSKLHIYIGAYHFAIDLNKFRNLRNRVKRFIHQNSPLPQYIVVDSIDCDLYSTVEAYVEPNGRAMKKRIEMIYENAEGPTHITFITKAEYHKFEPSYRDYAAEQMNY